MKNSSKSTYIVSALILLLIAFGGGWQFGKASMYYTGTEKDEKSAAIRKIDLDPFWKAWDLLERKHVDSSSTTAQTMVWGAIKGLASSYGDPYTVFMPPSEAEQFNTDIKGELEGVGMEIDIKEGVLTVVSPIKNSPAEKAGVLSGDRIVKVDGKGTENMTTDQAVKLIRGPKGTDVKITLYRKGVAEPLEKTITRAVIDIPTVKTEIKKGATSAQDVFVMNFYSFNAKSVTAFENGLVEFKKTGLKKLIINLRGNPGGYLDSAIEIAGHFIPSGEVVVREDFGSGQKPKLYKSLGPTDFGAKDYDIVVLINGGSASASEILAGALSEYGIAKLVGTKSFGKGSVQELMNLTSDTSLKITIAKWLTPNGKSIAQEGIMPDYEVKMTPEDYDKGKDPQLDKALEIVRKMR